MDSRKPENLLPQAKATAVRVSVAARYLGVSPSTMRRLCADGKVMWTRMPGSSHRRISVESVMMLAGLNQNDLVEERKPDLLRSRYYLNSDRGSASAEPGRMNQAHGSPAVRSSTRIVR